MRMRILVLLCALLGAGCGGPASEPSPSPTNGGRPMALPITTDGIHVGLAFNSNVADTSVEVGKVDYVWGGSRLKQRSDVFSTAYLPYDRAYDDTMDIAKFAHPDWIMYRCDRRTPAYEFGGKSIPIDITNPAVRAYQWGKVLERLQRGHYQGVGWDNLVLTNSAMRCGHWRGKTWVPLGYDGASGAAKFRADVLNWADEMYHRAKASKPSLTVAMNVSVGKAAPDVIQDLSPYLDLVYNERGYYSFGNYSMTGANWTVETAALEYLNAHGKAFVVEGTVPATSRAAVTPGEISWVIANYLLVKGEHSYTNIYPRSGEAPGEWHDMGAYHITIGHPTSSRQEINGVQVREYSGGIALVNPSASRTATFALSRAATDLAGTMVSGDAVLPPATGLVLLHQ